MLDVPIPPEEGVTITNVGRYIASMSSAIHDLRVAQSLARPGAGDRLSGSQLEVPEPGPITDVADAANAVKVLDGIARELGTELSRGSMVEALLDIYHAILRKNRGTADHDDGPKDEWLAETAGQDTDMRSHLESELARSRGILSKIGGALGVPEWDSEGTQLVEGVQRWSTFQLLLSRRIRALRTSKSDMADAIADECQTNLASLMTPKQFGKWLEASTAAVSIVAFTPHHLRALADFIREGTLGGDHASEKYLDEAIWDIAHSADATDEFVRFLNVVILPIIARQRAATGAKPGYLDCPR